MLKELTVLPGKQEKPGIQDELKRIKIAVVLPVYNTSKYLRECADSLIEQTHANFKVFVVDDGSTDDSAIILDEYAAKDARFIVWHLANGGVSAARNFALKQIEKVGGFHLVAFCDSDDILSRDCLRLYAYGMTKFEAQFVTLGYVKFDKNGIVHGVRKKESHPPIMLKGENLLRFGLSLHPEFRNSPATAYFLNNVAFCATDILGLRFDEKRLIGEDAEFRFQALRRMKKGVAFSDVGYRYRLRKSSLSSNMSLFSLYSSLELFLGWLNPGNQIPENISKDIEKVLLKKFRETMVWAYENDSLYRSWNDFRAYYDRIRSCCSVPLSVHLLLAAGPKITKMYLYFVRFGRRLMREKLGKKMFCAFD